MPPT